MHRSLHLADAALLHDVGRAVREARELAGWSQRELARRARVSQSCVSRLERAQPPSAGVDLLARVLGALGLRGTFEVSSVALEDRRDQRMPIHGVVLVDAVRRLRRCGWHTATEVEVRGRDGAPRGWIDLLAYRDADGAGLLGEIKGDIPDPGALQRQVGFYAREANAAMRALGWRPGRITTLVVALDTAAVHATVRAHAQLLSPMFTGSPPAVARWLRDAGAGMPPPTLALVDPRTRRRDWLLRTPLTGRRSPPTWASYAEAARDLMTPPRPPRGPPGRTPSSTRSRPP